MAPGTAAPSGDGDDPAGFSRSSSSPLGVGAGLIRRPRGPAIHEALAAWVRAGNALLCFGRGDGPYETLPAWWNEGRGGVGPWPDLYRRLGLGEAPGKGLHRVGAGVVLVEPRGPVALARDKLGARLVRARLRAALAAPGAGAPPYSEQPYLLLRRGAYLIAAAPYGAPSAVTGRLPLRLPGLYIDLLDGDLPVRRDPLLAAGGHAVLIDLARLARPCVAAASARITEERATDRALRFCAAGPAGTEAWIRLALPAPPQRALVGDAAVAAPWDAASGTALIRHPNAPDGDAITVEY